MSAMRYLYAAGLYAFFMMVLYGKREAVPREFFSKKDGDLYKKISEKKRDTTEVVNFTAILKAKGGVAGAKAEVAKDK